MNRPALPPLKTTGATLAACAMLSACGGGDGTALKASSPTSAPPNLSASVSALALSVNDTSLNGALTGNPRTIRVTNTGSSTAAQSLTISGASSLPSGTSLTTTCGATLPPGASCLITITPGVTASALPGDTAAAPVSLSIAGSNTNTLSFGVSVLTYGSYYEGGYLFAVDDTTPTTGSIGGTVAAPADSANPGSGILWQATATTTGANSPSNGPANTATIVSDLGTPTSAYAAGVCKATISGYSDWYLPAICEMGYDSASNGTGCGSSSSPTRQNMQSNPVDNGNIGSLSGYYWSSTETTILPATYSWGQYLTNNGATNQRYIIKTSTEGVRCVRSLTP